jgi:hypothetical protein
MKHLILLSVYAVFIFAACTTGGRRTPIATERAIQADSLPGACAYLTKDNKGNTILSWVRSVNDSNPVFCYAAFKNGRLGSPVIIPSSTNIQVHSENLPKIIFKPSGEVIALWGAANPNPNNKYSGLVFYAQSFDEGKTWTRPKSLTKDTASYDQRYYDVALLPDGEAGIIWLDNRKTTTKEGSGLFFAKTTGGNGFGNDQLISEPCCQCCRTDLFVDSKGGIHALYRGIIDDSIRDMVHIVSTDGGSHFSAPKHISQDNWVINGCPHTGPAMAENKEGLHFAWFTGGSHKGCYYSQSADNGNSFTVPDSISRSGSHPQLAALPGGELITVWDEAVTVNDKPYKRIGVQKRTAAGAAEGKGFITPDTATASYPVVLALAGKESFVAYSLRKGEKNYIMYQVVN